MSSMLGGGRGDQTKILMDQEYNKSKAIDDKLNHEHLEHLSDRDEKITKIVLYSVVGAVVIGILLIAFL